MEKRQALEAGRTPDRLEAIRQEEIVAELRALYMKALPGKAPPGQEPLVVEAREAPGEE